MIDDTPPFNIGGVFYFIALKNDISNLKEIT